MWKYDKKVPDRSINPFYKHKKNFAINKNQTTLSIEGVLGTFCMVWLDIETSFVIFWTSDKEFLNTVELKLNWNYWYYPNFLHITLVRTYWVSSSDYSAASLQGCDDASLGYGDTLLLHCFMDTCAVLIIHLCNKQAAQRADFRLNDNKKGIEASSSRLIQETIRNLTLIPNLKQI